MLKKLMKIENKTNKEKKKQVMDRVELGYNLAPPKTL